jgi:hypothetical protein
LSVNFLRKGMIVWLLEGAPWVVYRTLVDLQDYDETEKSVVAAKDAVDRHPLVRKIFRGLNDEGYWGKSKDIHTWWPRKDTTFWLLPVLADFGYTTEDERITRACEYVFDTQLQSGAFGWDPPTKPGDCHTAIIVESLGKMGLQHDVRLKKAYGWLEGRQRLDGGFWCKDTGQVAQPREREPSCAMAAMFVLGALAQNPEFRKGEVASRAVDFLFDCWENRGKIKYAGHDSQVGSDWEKLKYPFTDYKILKFLDVLSQFPSAQRRLQKSEMVKLLLQKQDANGRFTSESTTRFWADFDFGQKDQPSRWITLLVLRIMKRLAR